LRFVPYDRPLLLKGLSSGVIVWTDMDRLDRSRLSDAMAVHREIACSDVRQLNNPAFSLRRFDLMRRLFESGDNAFNVYRLSDAAHVRKFPVFIRRESGVAKHEPRLYHDSTELRAAISRLKLDDEARNDLMVVELLNMKDADGYFRKYGAYRVDDCIYPQHILFGNRWFVKTPEPAGRPSLLAEHLEYFNTNPHAKELLNVFLRAGIEYGRVDYGLREGRIQVFEINTNPSVLNDPPTPFDILDHQPYADRHAEAMLRLPDARRAENLDDPTQHEIRKVHDAVVASLASKFRRRRTRLTIRRALRRALRRMR
jgi:hypothetical protein